MRTSLHWHSSVKSSAHDSKSLSSLPNPLGQTCPCTGVWGLLSCSGLLFTESQLCILLTGISFPLKWSVITSWLIILLFIYDFLGCKGGLPKEVLWKLYELLRGREEEKQALRKSKWQSYASQIIQEKAQEMERETGKVIFGVVNITNKETQSSGETHNKADLPKVKSKYPEKDIRSRNQ